MVLERVKARCRARAAREPLKVWASDRAIDVERRARFLLEADGWPAEALIGWCAGLDELRRDGGYCREAVVALAEEVGFRVERRP